jgi:hypothetical protein
VRDSGDSYRPAWHCRHSGYLRLSRRRVGASKESETACAGGGTGTDAKRPSERPASASHGGFSGCALSLVVKVGCSAQPTLCRGESVARLPARLHEGRYEAREFVSDRVLLSQWPAAGSPIAQLRNTGGAALPARHHDEQARSDPMADPVPPPTWNSDWANLCRSPGAHRPPAMPQAETPTDGRGRVARNCRMSTGGSLLSYSREGGVS